MRPTTRWSVRQRQAVAEPLRRAEAVGDDGGGRESAPRSRPRRSSSKRPPPTKLKAIGVKIVEDVDKKSFAAISDPYLDKLAKELGPHAEKIKNLIRAIN